MNVKKKSKKKIWLLFVFFFILYAFFINLLGSISQSSNSQSDDSVKIENYEKKEIDLLNLKKYPFGKSLENTLLEIGVNDGLKAICEKDNSFGMTLLLTTSTRRLWVSIDDYFEEVREVNWIKDYDNHHIIYYTSDKLNYNEPIYSYKTGEIIIDKIDGESEKYPLVITVDQLVNEITRDIKAAANKYNGKWIKITGTVTFISDGGDMYGYYLYGKRGDRGLKITCWINQDEKLTSVGATKTFLGIMREITTANNTEIANCKIIN